jgi:hypothetical protein
MFPERKDCATLGNRKSETECKVGGSKKNIWNAGTLNIHVPDGLCLLVSWRL